MMNEEMASLESTGHDDSFFAGEDDELIEDENDVVLDGDDDENDHMVAEAINDVYGSTSDRIKTFEDAEEMLKRARTELVEAFRSIPDVGEMRKAYDQAVLKCPHLIELESPPDKYLRAHDFNAWEASYAMVYYWRKRVEVFGPDLAYYPLSLTGKGVSWLRWSRIMSFFRERLSIFSNPCNIILLCPGAFRKSGRRYQNWFMLRLAGI